MARIVILHPGAMGAAVGSALREAGHEVGWLAEGRSPATRARAESAGLQPWASCADADAVISHVPPAAAVSTARGVAGFTGLYLDANATSPQRSAEVAEVMRSGGATHVDGSIVGPPPTDAGTTRLFVSGAAAARAAELFVASTLEPVVLAAGDYSASALKMAYASWSKISAALVLSADRTAQAYGVAEELHAEWRRSQPDLEGRLDRARASAASKGWRWVDEMAQIAATFAAAGEPAPFGEGAAAVYGRYPRPGSAQSQSR
jgi:3-hydroxyisobutyrate dehydrogenase-like beta-hydroxyacid dehydrogenase